MYTTLPNVSSCRLQENDDIASTIFYRLSARAHADTSEGVLFLLFASVCEHVLTMNTLSSTLMKIADQNPDEAEHRQLPTLLANRTSPTVTQSILHGKTETKSTLTLTLFA